jgi:Serine hydrolase
MSDVYAIFVHGIGTQASDFADLAKLELDRGLRPLGSRLYARSAHYAPLLDAAGEVYLREVKAAGSRGNLTQQLSILTLADALQYGRNSPVRDQVHYLLDYEVVRLRAPETLTIFAHSLGCLVVLDWLRSRTAVRNVKLVTMGCNLGLFELGKTVDVPVQVEQPGDWLNLFDPSDGLGFALNTPSHPEFCHVKDVKVQVGGLVTGNTGLAHMQYLSDRKLWRREIPELLSKA